MRTLTDMKRETASALLAIFVLAGAAASLSACNTARGFGQDMSAAGSAVSNSAERIKNGE